MPDHIRYHNFQKSIQLFDSEVNYLLDDNTLNISGAIEGRYTSILKSGRLQKTVNLK